MFGDSGLTGLGTVEPPISRRSRDDSGFSLVELIVALTILLITLIALMRLATTSSFMVSTARERAAMINVAAGYLDRVRQLPYAEVGLAGGDPIGGMRSETTTTSPYVVTVTPAVSWGRPENTGTRLLKTVVLQVSAQDVSGGSRMAFTMSTLVADVGAVGLVTVSGPTTPTCTIVSPATGSVVWGSAVPVTASATARLPGRTLVWMDMLDGVQSWGSTTLSGTSDLKSWTWNTSAAREGNHSITARATDSSYSVGNSAPILLTVDNLAPTVPASLSCNFPTNAGANIWWGASMDGTDLDGMSPLPASHYLLWAYKQPSDTSVAGDYTRWSVVSGLNPATVVQAPASTAPLGLTGLSAFSRYAVAVSSCSPDRGASSGLMSAPVVVTGATEYSAVGTWSVSGSGSRYDVTASLRVPAGPTFPWSGTAQTSVYRLTAPTSAYTAGALVGTVASAYPTWSGATVTDTYQTHVTAPAAYWYVAVTSLTPQGYGGAPTIVRSCVLAPPADYTSVGARAMVFAQW